ncbi:DUF2017 family protein [Demequina rhizosphaerae]|uniref:DUF2017 family protein n=1 Tax=Demequina rhizosphaerae TaxID=1638985 RepID=UPI000781BECE|nr:DUF2017 family protein [Demequina rhizosphaerae]
MRGFAERDGAAVAALDEDERLVIARIVADVGLLLGGEDFGAERHSGLPHREDLAEALAFLDALADSPAEPDDPALLRLLPNAAPEDREVAEEFRRLTQDDLRASKLSRLRRIWDELSADGGEWVVPAEDVMATAAALTDVRLVLASRLGLERDEDAETLHEEIARASAALEQASPAEVGIDPERLWLGMVYDALTWLQESLVSLTLGGSR